MKMAELAGSNVEFSAWIDKKTNELDIISEMSAEDQLTHWEKENLNESMEDKYGIDDI